MEKPFCPIPFLQLQLNPLGHVSACCFSDQYKVGDIKEKTLEQIWNDEAMRRWRREFLTGDIKICAHAMKTFECHKTYDRLLPHVEKAEVQTRAPRRLDLRLNGKCNLECVMCYVWQDPNGLYDKSDFWTYGHEKIFPHLLEIDLLGGEPLIQKDTFRLIDEITAVNKTCRWSFVTNANYRLTDRLRGYLDRIEIGCVQISLDSVNPETYARIRRKGELAKTLQTVEALILYERERQAKGRGFGLAASMCVQKLNWREIPDFLDYCDQHRLTPILQNMINRPELSLTTLPRDERRTALDFLWPHLTTGPHRKEVAQVARELTRSMEDE